MSPALASIGGITDRVSTVVARQNFTRAMDAFTFDRQPGGNLDRVFRLTAQYQGEEAWLGGSGDDQYQVEVFAAIRARKDTHAAARQLTADLAVVRDEIEADVDLAILDYFVVPDSARTVVQPPGEGADFVVGRLSVLVQFPYETR